jgi:hypothetical protein
MGYVFQGLVLGPVAALLWIFTKTVPSTWKATTVVGSSLVLIVILAWCAGRWGFNYALAADRSGR